MTIEQLQSEKRVLKEKIEKALREFYEATGFKVSGKFGIESKLVSTAWVDRDVKRTSPVVTINPIEI